MNVLLSLLFAVNAAAQTPAAQSVRPGSINGHKIFSANCEICHGKDAKGKAVMAMVFRVKPEAMNLVAAAQSQKDADLAKVIASGRGKMPAFKGKLKDAEIASVLAYIRSLAPKKKPSGLK